VAGITIELTIERLPELLDQLATMPARTQKAVLKRSLQPAAKLMLAAAQQQAPVDTGLLKRGLKVQPRANRGGVAMLVSATVSRKAAMAARFGRRLASGGQSAYELFYASFVELGHKRGSRKLRSVTKARVNITARRGRTRYAATRVKIVETIDNRGPVPARPFMRPAFEATRENAVAAIEADFPLAVQEALE
jgi:HK97 gp10 family phage protein